MNETERKLALKKAIETKNAELKDLLAKYPRGYPACCGTLRTLEDLWRWQLGCRGYTADLEEELFGTSDGSHCEQVDAEFDEMFRALAPDLNLPVAALEL